MEEPNIQLAEQINKLKKELNAVILAHNYQLPEVQDVADFVGDSLELSLKSMDVDARHIVFAGVHFMAEQAALLNPDKIVLHPDVGARCHMAGMLPRDAVLEFKRKYSKLPLLLYVNTLAEAKAEADYICTSANAVDVASKIPSDAILFGPDANLAKYVEMRSGKRVVAIPPYGHCYVHLSFTPADIEKMKDLYPDAEALAHPECTLDVVRVADFVGSTSQMLRRARESDARRFIVATEVGLLYRMKKENPRKEFISAYSNATCVYMKRITMTKILESLRKKKYKVVVPSDVSKRAADALHRTLDLLKVKV